MSSLEAHIQAVSQLASGAADPEILSSLMSDGKDPGARALVYRNSGLKATCDALASNYPAVKTFMGAEFFNQMARGYTDKHPPHARSLVGYGHALPAYIADARERHGMVRLSDLARLDQAWLEAHLAASVDEFSAEDSARLSKTPEAMIDLKLKTVPSVSLVALDWELHSAWISLRAGKSAYKNHLINRAEQIILVWRLDNEVRTRITEPATALFLTHLGAGQTLGAAAEAALELEPKLDIATLLATTISAGLFTLDNAEKEIAT